jgi:hypothetical protein
VRIGTICRLFTACRSMSRATYTNVTTFHWAVAQLTLGSIEIVCANSIERIYNVFCMLIGLLFGSALISSLSATMVEIQTARKDQTQKLRVLRHYYMRENPIEAKLSNFVMRQVAKRVGLQPPTAWGGTWWPSSSSPSPCARISASPSSSRAS